MVLKLRGYQFYWQRADIYSGFCFELCGFQLYSSLGLRICVMLVRLKSLIVSLGLEPPCLRFYLLLVCGFFLWSFWLFTFTKYWYGVGGFGVSYPYSVVNYKPYLNSYLWLVVWGTTWLSYPLVQKGQWFIHLLDFLVVGFLLVVCIVPLLLPLWILIREW